MKSYVSVETPQSSICNLDCVYCYIPKNKFLNSINNKWAKKFESGEYLETLSEYYSTNELENLSLWGGEPSLGFKYFKNLESIFKKFPKIKHISTSSNFVGFENHKEFLIKLNEICEKQKINLSFDLQLSIDGTESDTNKNRGQDIYKKIVSNIDKLFELSPEIKNFKVVVHVKSTNTDEDFKSFATDDNRLRNYLEAFIKLDKDHGSGRKWPENFRVDLFTLPTLALPGRYTKEDGQNFLKYCLLLEKLLDKYKRNHNEQYSVRLKELYHNGYLVNQRFSTNEAMMCSAGVASAGLDPDGIIHPCHFSFWHSQDGYLESTNDLSDWKEGRRILDFDSKSYWENTQNIISNFRDTYNYDRIKYILSAFANNINHKLAISFGTIKMLAIAGQISPIYKTNEWAHLFANYIALKGNCWANNILISGSLFPPPISVYRMFGNGLFEHLVNKFGEKINEV